MPIELLTEFKYKIRASMFTFGTKMILKLPCKLHLLSSAIIKTLLTIV